MTPSPPERTVDQLRQDAMRVLALHDAADAAEAAPVRAARPRGRAGEPFAGSDVAGMPPRGDLGRTERRAMLGISVPRRSAWPDLNQIDERIGDLTRRHAEAQEAVREIMEQRANAPAADADRLAAWELAGRKGAKPAATADTLDLAVADAELTRDALERAGDVVLEERASYVDKHRDRLAAVADQQTAAAHERMLALIDELEVSRADLIECRRAAIWARCYPDAAASGSAPTAQIARGLAAPVSDLLGLRPAPQLIAARLLELLRKDAELLANAITPEQAKHLGGDAKPTDGAPVWVDTDDGREQTHRERQEARARYEREWGKPPSW